MAMIKLGQREVTAGWFDLFAQAEIYAVSLVSTDPKTAFVFGPKEDRNYMAVFTRRDIAQKCLQEMPQLKHLMSLRGSEWLQLALQSGRGLWINPLNEACTMQFPATSLGELIRKIRENPTAEPPVIAAAQPVTANPSPATPVRLAIGPSPWTWRDRSHVVQGKKYRFREHELDGKPSAATKILNEQDECLLLLGVHCYARFLDDGTCLLWWKGKVRGVAVLEFRCFALTSLKAINDVDAAARALMKEEEHVIGLCDCESFTFESEVLPVRHPVSAPASLAKFEETLVLGHFQPVNPTPGQQDNAIFVFDWLKGEVEVIPQDWFNKGSYDFDYRWISRVARLSNGRIAGDGVRLGRFELDETGRQIGRWLDQNDGYMLS